MLKKLKCNRISNLTPKEKQQYWGLMKSHDVSTPDYQVFLFCKSVFRKTFPVDLIGKSNWGVLFKALDQFVKLRRLEQMQLQSIVSGMSTNDLTWTWPGTSPQPPHGRQDHNKRRELLLELMFWIFDCFVPTLIRSHFYATEVLQNVPVNRVVFFRHDVWIKVSSFAFGDFCKQSSLARQNNPELSLLGAAPIRIIPKEEVGPSMTKISGYRPIVRMGRMRQTLASTGVVQTPSINTLLKDVFSALSFEHTQKINSHGFYNVGTTGSIPDLFRRILHFKQQIGIAPTPKLFFVKVDIKHCFDTIPQALALQISKRLLSNESFKEYFLHAFKVFKVPLPAPSKKKNRHKPAVLVKYIRNPEYNTNTETSMDVVQGISKDLANTLRESAVHGPGTLASKTANIVVDLVYGVHKSGEDLANLLQAHLTQNLVYLEGKRKRQLYKQQIGIPQGSILSTLLCNLVYEELEAEILADIFKDSSTSSPYLLARFTDDFLFVSTNQDHAEAFLNKMITGVPKYGAAVRPEKTIINFVPSLQTNKTTLCKVLAPGEIFPYIGIGIDPQTLNIFRDFEQESISNEFTKKIKQTITPVVPQNHKTSVCMGVSDRVTVPHRGIRSSPVSLTRMLLHFISMRLLRAFVDLRVNSWETILQNVSTVVIEVARRLVFALDMKWGFTRVGSCFAQDATTMINILVEVLDKVCSIVIHVNGPEVVPDYNEGEEKFSVLQRAAADIEAVLGMANKSIRHQASWRILRVGVDYLKSL